MKIQILPNWCKKIGLLLFFIFSFISGGDDFIDGFRSGYSYGNSTSSIITQNNSHLFKSYFGNDWLHIFSILSIIGILIYMLSKEKIEDEFINKLRLESFQITAIIILILSIFLYTLSENIKLTLDYFIFIFTLMYSVIFFTKKQMD